MTQHPSTHSNAALNVTVAAVTARIEQRRAASRAAYLDVLARAKKPGPYPGGMGCANAAHAYAAMPPTAATPGMCPATRFGWAH